MQARGPAHIVLPCMDVGCKPQLLWSTKFRSSEACVTGSSLSMSVLLAADLSHQQLCLVDSSGRPDHVRSWQLRRARSVSTPHMLQS